MKKFQIILLYLFAVTFLLFFPKISFAHPGNTASDGCHYCRTRCDYWGVAWNARHCHGGRALPPPPPASNTLIFPSNTATPVPTRIPTIKPSLTSTPTSTLTPTSKPELLESPTSVPEVKGEAAEITQTPVPTDVLSPTLTTQEDRFDSDNSESNGKLILAVIGFIGWIFYKYRGVLKERFKKY